MKRFTFTKDKDKSTTLEDIKGWKEDKEELREELNKRWQNLLNPDPRKFKSFVVIIDNERGNEMPAYWVLIDIVKKWYFESGMIYTKEQIDYMFKIMAGHSTVCNGIHTPRSIAYNSDCTWQDMSNLIETIIAFGKDPDNNIIGLELKEKDRDKIKSGFNK